MNEEIITRAIRVEMPATVSVAEVQDIMNCLPPDAIITNVHFDIRIGRYYLFLVHPEFPPTKRGEEIAAAELVEERFVSLMGEHMTRCVGVKVGERVYEPK